MRIALLILCAVIGTAIIAYWLSFPRNSHYVFSRPGGGSMTFSRTGVSFQFAPDHYASNGFGPYISKLLATTNGYRFLHIFTPDGKRGFGFSARDGSVETFLTIEWRQEAQREATIREFFSSLTPSQDYLAGNGGVPDATRVLAYRTSGSSGAEALLQVSLSPRERAGVRGNGLSANPTFTKQPCTSTDRGCVGDQPQQRSNSNGSWKTSFCCAHALGP